MLLCLPSLLIFHLLKKAQLARIPPANSQAKNSLFLIGCDTAAVILTLLNWTASTLTIEIEMSPSKIHLHGSTSLCPTYHIFFPTLNGGLSGSWKNCSYRSVMVSYIFPEDFCFCFMFFLYTLLKKFRGKAHNYLMLEKMKSCLSTQSQRVCKQK